LALSEKFIINIIINSYQSIVKRVNTSENPLILAFGLKESIKITLFIPLSSNRFAILFLNLKSNKSNLFNNKICGLTAVKVLTKLEFRPLKGMFR
jgi:hypothetical protein